MGNDAFLLDFVRDSMMFLFTEIERMLWRVYDVAEKLGLSVLETAATLISN